MRIPIALALTYPERLPLQGRRLDLASVGSLDFEAPDLERFPALRLSQAALRGSEVAPAVLNAVNEVTVQAFLRGMIGFTDIASTNQAVLDAHLRRHRGESVRDLEDVMEADAWARRMAWEQLGIPSGAEAGARPWTS
jgi:1-deoxy-D-xylulose-5-phosphate reductoisomerase